MHQARERMFGMAQSLQLAQLYSTKASSVTLANIRAPRTQAFGIYKPAANAALPPPSLVMLVAHHSVSTRVVVGGGIVGVLVSTAAVVILSVLVDGSAALGKRAPNAL